jgi:hypothetical protein
MSEYRPTSLTTRIEQAIAFGRSWDWMNQHLGATDRDIDAAMRRLDAAVADDEPTYLAAARAADPVDEDEAKVRAYMAGELTGQGLGTVDPNRVEAVRRLAADGLTDLEIAALLGSSREAVQKTRQRRGIPGGSVGRLRGASWAALTRAEPRARRVRAEREAVA